MFEPRESAKSAGHLAESPGRPAEPRESAKSASHLAESPDDLLESPSHLIESPGAPTEFPGALFDVPLSGPDGVISLVLDGEVDQRLSAELDELLRSVRESTAREVVVELEHVTGMDSCGVDFLSALATLTKARGGQLRLADPPPAILALFELAHDGRLPGLVEASTEGWNRTLPA